MAFSGPQTVINHLSLIWSLLFLTDLIPGICFMLHSTLIAMGKWIRRDVQLEIIAFLLLITQTFFLQSSSDRVLAG